MEGVELRGDAFLVVLFMGEKQFHYSGVKLKKKCIYRNPSLVYFTLDHQWDSEAKVVMVFRKLMGSKEIISLVPC